MWDSDIPDRLVILLIGVIVLLSPALILVLTLAFLAFTGDLVFGRVTPLELLELYLVDLALIAAVAYGLYRLVRVLLVHRLPKSLDALDPDDADEDEVEGASAGGPTEERDGWG